MKVKAYLLPIVMFLATAFAMAQEDNQFKKIELEKKDNNGNVTKTVTVVPADELDKNLKNLNLPADVQTKFQEHFDNNYSNDENYVFSHSEDGTSYEIEINNEDDVYYADDVVIGNDGKRVEIIRKNKNHTLLPNFTKDRYVMGYSGERGEQAFLGVHVKGFNFNESSNMKDVRGVEVEKLEEGEAAFNAGLEVGDVITEINGIKTPSPSLFKDAVAELEPREEVTFTYYRNGAKQTSNAIAGVAKSGVWNFNFPNRDTGFLKEFNWNVRKAQLGIMVSDDENGAKITKVNEESAAEEAGLQEGDIITKINDIEIKNGEELSETIREMEVGDEIDIEYLRDGNSMKTKATLKKGSFYQFYLPEGKELNWDFDESSFQKSLEELNLQLAELQPNMEEIQLEIEQNMENLEPQLKQIEQQLEQQMKELEPQLEQQMKELEPQLEKLSKDLEEQVL